jgi:hypothetical protein
LSRAHLATGGTDQEDLLGIVIGKGRETNQTFNPASLLTCNHLLCLFWGKIANSHHGLPTEKRRHCGGKSQTRIMAFPPRSVSSQSCADAGRL